MKRKLLSSMTALIALFGTSCSSDLLLEGQDTVGANYGEEAEVTFTVSAESANATTRATRADTDAKGPGFNQRVGRGSKIDVLIYAVYEKDSVEVTEDNVTKKEVVYTLLKQYGDGTVPDGLAGTKAFLDGSSHDGQTIVYDPFGKNSGNNGTHEITLRLMRGKEYTIAFWAQSSETDAYNTSDLENVKVSYEGAKNNDEARDAFCKSESFTLGADASRREVFLTRPLAQVNVGTTGADYERVRNDRTTQRFVDYSEITIEGVATSMNVVKDEISSDNRVTATFTRNVIPAYMYGDLEEFKNSTTTPSEKEEFLFVKLIPKSNPEEETRFLPYWTTYPTVDLETKLPKTETFKYLSMCYVLVPASNNLTNVPNYNASNNEDNNKYEETDPYTSTVLGSIEFKFAEKEDGMHSFPAVTLSNVPVHRNWRTNILGGLNENNIPNDNDDEDPFSVFKLPVIYVSKDVTYDGDYNGNYDTNKPDDNVTWDEAETPNNSEEGEEG